MADPVSPRRVSVLLVHGIGNPKPESMLGPRPKALASNDRGSGLYESGSQQADHRKWLAYMWGGLVTGKDYPELATVRGATPGLAAKVFAFAPFRVLWLAVLPFTLLNLAFWMDQHSPRRQPARTRVVTAAWIFISAFLTALFVILLGGVFEALLYQPCQSLTCLGDRDVAWPFANLPPTLTATAPTIAASLAILAIVVAIRLESRNLCRSTHPREARSLPPYGLGRDAVQTSTTDRLLSLWVPVLTIAVVNAHAILSFRALQVGLARESDGPGEQAMLGWVIGLAGPRVLSTILTVGIAAAFTAVWLGFFASALVSSIRGLVRGRARCTNGSLGGQSAVPVIGFSAFLVVAVTQAAAVSFSGLRGLHVDANAVTPLSKSLLPAAVSLTVAALSTVIILLRRGWLFLRPPRGALEATDREYGGRLGADNIKEIARARVFAEHKSDIPLVGWLFSTSFVIALLFPFYRERTGSAATAIVGFVGAGVIAVAIRAAKSKGWRDRLGLLWDVLSFWPPLPNGLGTPQASSRAV